MLPLIYAVIHVWREPLLLSLTFFYLFTTLLSSLPCRSSSYWRRHTAWSNVLKYSVLAHAHVLQKLVMNVNNAKAIKIILDLIRSNTLSIGMFCRCAQCQTSEMSNFTSPTNSHVETELEKTYQNKAETLKLCCFYSTHLLRYCFDEK